MTRDVVEFSLALALACLASYSLVMYALADVHSLSHTDDLIGGLWALVATVFVFRPTHDASLAAAKARVAATAFSLVACFAYLVIFSFHPWAMAALVGAGALVLTALGRPDDVAVAGITTGVVMVSATISPHQAWQQPLLRAVDTAVGIAVGLAASWLATAEGSGFLRHAHEG